MSYGKRDEDADLGLVKVDRTQVFQEGKQAAMAPAGFCTAELIGRQHDSSTAPPSNLDDVAFS